MQALKERRKHERFNVDQSCVLLSPLMVLSYEVLDISNSGLAFSYAGWENWPRKGVNLDFIDQNLYLEALPVRIIKDAQLDEGSKKLRRCGVKFTDLNAQQEAMVKQYIESVTSN